MNKILNLLVKFIFFGNYFYGICVVALSVEASLQQMEDLNNILYYIASFAAATLYYTKAYYADKATICSDVNKRSIWYAKHSHSVWWSQVIFTIFLFLFIVYTLLKYNNNLLHVSLSSWVLIFIFPLVAALYYGVENRFFKKYNLRNIGWLKPFVIGFCWAGLVNIYPVLYLHIQKGLHYTINWISTLLFIKNFMYISVLCILFDIKDYAQDHNQKLKTFVVKVGLRKTIFSIIIPLCLLGWCAFIFFGVIRHFSAYKIIINTIPFIALICVAYAMHRRKSIFYYLIIIDGLMLLKAICGIVAMLYF